MKRSKRQERKRALRIVSVVIPLLVLAIAIEYMLHISGIWCGVTGLFIGVTAVAIEENRQDGYERRYRRCLQHIHDLEREMLSGGSIMELDQWLALRTTKQEARMRSVTQTSDLLQLQNSVGITFHDAQMRLGQIILHPTRKEENDTDHDAVP